MFNTESQTPKDKYHTLSLKLRTYIDKLTKAEDRMAFAKALQRGKRGR